MEIKLIINSYFIFAANTGLYAHYVFNVLDKDHTGTLSFEVRLIWILFANISFWLNEKESIHF